MSDPAAIIRKRVLAKYPRDQITLENAFEAFMYLADVKDAETAEFVDDKLMGCIAAILEELQFLYEEDPADNPATDTDNDE